MNKLVTLINSLNNKIGRTLSYLLLIMIFTSFFVVFLRYFVGLGWVWMQEIVSYCHAILFLGSFAYALLHDEHVRVDLFYRPLRASKKAWVNLFGNVFLLMPTAIYLLILCFPYVKDSWEVFEGSNSGGGLELVFLLKSMLLIFPSLLILQSISNILSSILFLTAKGKH